jgi:uncharacterized membrane-anchored protein
MTLSIVRLSISRAVWISLLLATASAPSMGQQPEGQGSVGAQIRNLGWKAGPSEGKIAGRATITIPAKYVFLGAADTSKFLTLMRNLPRTESYTFAPQDLSWFSIFDFEDTGYIKDDEKIDADAVLQSLKEGNARGNEERKKRGYPALNLDGWFVAPRYDTDTKRLEWATKLSSEGGVSVNYRIRILGRAGVMSAVLVSDPDSLEKDIRVFKGRSMTSPSIRVSAIPSIVPATRLPSMASPASSLAARLLPPPRPACSRSSASLAC